MPSAGTTWSGYRIRALKLPPKLRRQQRRIEHFHRQAAVRLVALGGTAAELLVLEALAERLRERAVATYVPPRA